MVPTTPAFVRFVGVTYGGLTMSQPPTRIARLATAGVIAAAVLIVVGLLISSVEQFDIDTLLYRLGIALAMTSATLVVIARGHATDQQIECIRQVAYDAGYCDGAEVSRVVQMRRSAAPVVPLAAVPGDGPAQQLGDQRHVGNQA